MDYFRKFDDLGVICTNHWYVMDMHIRNHDEDGNLTGPQGNGHMGYTGTGEGGCFFHTEQMSDYGISEVSVDYGEDSIFDVKKVQNHLCQECLDKLVESMEVFCEETQKPKPRDLVLVDLSACFLLIQAPFFLPGDIPAPVFFQDNLSDPAGCVEAMNGV